MADSLERLFAAVQNLKKGDPARSRTARLIRAGRSKIAKKLGEEAVEVVIDAMQGDREKSLDAGASDYVTKPVDTEELLTCMERWLTGRA